MKPVRLTIKKGTSEKEIRKLTNAYEDEGSFLGSDYKDGKLILIVDHDKSPLIQWAVESGRFTDLHNSENTGK